MMKSALSRRQAGLLVLSAAMALATGAAAAAAPEAGHDHHGAHAAKPLPAGKRWQSDAALREGMAGIRHAFEPHLKALHAGKLRPEDYQALAGKTEAQVGQIVAKCKLPPDADAALHGILGRIGEGTQAMAGKSPAKPRAGALQVVAALDEYGRTFDHPGWKQLHR